jgi:hypothetical protein
VCILKTSESLQDQILGSDSPGLVETTDVNTPGKWDSKWLGAEDCCRDPSSVLRRDAGYKVYKAYQISPTQQEKR